MSLPSSISLGRMNLEDALGPAKGRYFGAGYRTVRHRIDSFRLGRELAPRVQACGQVVYPSTWSLGADGSGRVAHLSSIDAIILPLLCWQESNSYSQRSSVLTSVKLKAGRAPWTELSDVPITIDIEDGDRDTILWATVANIRARLQLSHRSVQDAEPHVPLQSETVYGGLYRHVECTSTLTKFDNMNRCLGGEHRAWAAPAPPTAAGLESGYWPAMTPIDYLVVMGQLTQAGIYLADDLTRASVDNLWMRTMSMELPALPAPLPAHFTTRTRLTRDTALERMNVRLHDVAIESRSSNGVVAHATLAYTEKT